MGKKRALPRRPRLDYGGIYLLPMTDAAGFVIEDMWHVPGGWRASTQALRRLGARRGIDVRVLTNSD